MIPVDFFKTYGPLVVDQATAGQLPSVILAQMALESSWGASGLSSKYNNFFGFKTGAGWKGKTVNLDTGEVRNGIQVVENWGFRVYETPSDSIADRVSLINRLRIYDPVRQATTPQDQAKALQQAGYATDPDYASKLISIINKYNLIEFDKKKS